MHVPHAGLPLPLSWGFGKGFSVLLASWSITRCSRLTAASMRPGHRGPNARVPGDRSVWVQLQLVC